MGLLAQTSIHAGAGTSTGPIDLPIQREGQNGWPCVYGSAVKGALRTHAEQKKARLLAGQNAMIDTPEDYRENVQLADDIAVVYGPPTTMASEHAGAIMVSDARLLLFPVRSLTSQFKWVTSPEALKRYLRDAQRLGLNPGSVDIPDVIDTQEGLQAIVDEKAGSRDVFLEEYRFETQARNLGGVIGVLSGLMARDDAQTVLTKQLLIVSDDSFTYLTQHATPVNAHIAIDALSKTVSSGALWYEESLPPESLLYVALGAVNGRKAGAKLDAAAVMNCVLHLFDGQPWLQLGGNETVGMGWCAVKAFK